MDIFVENEEVKGVKLRTGAKYEAKAVVLATGTFLGGKIFIGSAAYENEPSPGGRRRRAPRSGPPGPPGRRGPAARSVSHGDWNTMSDGLPKLSYDIEDRKSVV